MARPLFEQYKDALRRGHVALLGDELDAALEAYREAASLVPARPLPYASIGAVLARLGRPTEAIEAYDRALALGPDDVAVADARAALRAALPEHGEPPAATAEPEAVDAAPAVANEPKPGAWPAVDLPSPPAPTIVGPPPDPAVLEAEAEARIDAGDPLGARDLLLTEVAVHRDAGRLDAALDACLQLLSIAPGDPRIHLAIANLQLDRGWDPVATEKIELLLRLTALSGDAQAEADVHLLAAERLRDESPSRLDARRKGLPAG